MRKRGDAERRKWEKEGVGSAVQEIEEIVKQESIVLSQSKNHHAVIPGPVPGSLTIANLYCRENRERQKDAGTLSGKEGR